MNLKGKKVLVTGADGFIGSHLSELLVQAGCEVRAFCLYNSFNSRGWLDDSEHAGAMEIISGDLRDAAFCRQAVKDIDTVFHLGALIAIPYSYSAPQSYVDTNIHGTLNICQAALDAGTSRVIHTSTSEVYGTACYVPIDEKHPLQPQSPYSATKIGADALAMSFHNSFELPLTVARPFNTFGPRQSARAVIPSVIIQLASGRERLELGDLTPTRDLNYVSDTCHGMMALAESAKAVGEVVNIGSGVEISIGDVVSSIQRIMGTSAAIVTDAQRIRPKNSEVFRLCADSSLLESLTGYTHGIGFEEGLRRTIEWFSDERMLRRYKADEYNI